MADVQMLPVLPQAPSGGDSGPSKAPGQGAGDGFGQALTQAKTTAKEKSHRGGDSPAKAGHSKEAPQKGPKAEKREKAAEKSVPILPSAPKAQKPSDGAPSQIAKNIAAKIREKAPQAPAENLTEAAPPQEGADQHIDQQMAAILALGEQAAANIINIESALPALAEAPPQEEGDAEEAVPGETNIAKDQSAPKAAQQPVGEAPAAQALDKAQQATDGAPKAQQPVGEAPAAQAPDKAQQATTVAVDDAAKAQQPVGEAPAAQAPDKAQQATEMATAVDDAAKAAQPAAEDIEIELAPELAQKLAEKPVKDAAKNREKIEGPSEKAEGKTEARPAEQRTNADKAAAEKAVRGQNRPQAAPRETRGMTAEEAGKALAVRSSEAKEAYEAAKGSEASKASNAPDAAQANGPKAPPRVPDAPPIIIESALPKQDKAQAKQVDAAEDAEARAIAKEGKETSAAPQAARGEGRRSNADADESASQTKQRQPRPEAEVKGHREAEAKAPNRGHNESAKASEKDGQDNGANADRQAHGPRGAGSETRARAGERARGNGNAAKIAAASKAEAAAAALPSAARMATEAAQAGRALGNGKYQPPIENIKPDHKAAAQQSQAPSEKIEPAASNASSANAPPANAPGADAAARGQAETVRHGHDGHGNGGADAKAAPSSTVSVSHTAPFSGPAASGPAQPTHHTAPAAPKPQLPPQAPMSQLDGSVRWLVRNNEKSAEIQLYPEHLGKVTVRLRIEGGEVHARVWASEASTLPMLKEHKAFLETSLKEQGLNLSSFDLQHGSAGQQARGGEGQNKPQGQNYHFSAPMMETWNGNEFRQELPTQLTAQPADDGSIELYA